MAPACEIKPAAHAAQAEALPAAPWAVPDGQGRQAALLRYCPAGQLVAGGVVHVPALHCWELEHTVHVAPDTPEQEVP